MKRALAFLAELLLASHFFFKTSIFSKKPLVFLVRALFGIGHCFLTLHLLKRALHDVRMHDPKHLQTFANTLDSRFKISRTLWDNLEYKSSIQGSRFQILNLESRAFANDCNRSGLKVPQNTGKVDFVCKLQWRFICIYIYTYVPWKSNHHFFIGWFPNYHYFSRCLSSSKNVGFQGIYVYTYRYLNIYIYIWHHLKRQPNNWPKKRSQNMPKAL